MNSAGHSPQNGSESLKNRPDHSHAIKNPLGENLDRDHKPTKVNQAIHHGSHGTIYRSIGKRTMDLLVASTLLILLLPLLLLSAFAVKLTSSGPFFFKQQRLGQRGIPFTIYKFRTMLDKPRIADREIHSGDTELTPVGGLLRRSKIDELPQLLNVVLGDMSLVGPRPGLAEQLDSYTETAHKRLLSRPGLTGLAQVNGNIHISWQQRWEYDARYVECLNLGLDLRIILKTIAVIIFGEQHFTRKPDV